MTSASAPSLSLVLTITAEISVRVDFGISHAGTRAYVPIVGGTFTGPRISGTILPGGGDWILVRSDGIVQGCARYNMRADDGTFINVTNSAILRREEELAYGRTVPVFEVENGKHDWLNKSVFVGELTPLSSTEVQIKVYEVL